MRQAIGSSTWQLHYNKCTILIVLSIFFGGSLIAYEQRIRKATALMIEAIVTSNDTVDANEVNLSNDPANATLGFEKIFVINMPSRSDRRDSLDLLSKHQDIQLDWLNGTHGSDIDRKAWPPHWPSSVTDENLARLGSWRSHLNLLRQIVEKKHASVLIMEDHVDWDVDIKKQMLLLAEKLPLLPPSYRPSLRQLSTRKPLASPYGSSWDILWVGSTTNPSAPPGALTYADPTSQRTSFLWEVTEHTAGSWAYAVTYESARALYGYMLDCAEPYDLRLDKFCGLHRCPLIWPVLIGHLQPMGDYSEH